MLLTHRLPAMGLSFPLLASDKQACESFPGVSMPIERWAIISRDGEAGWCGRRKHQVVSHGASLFLLGGYTSGGVIGTGHGAGANLNDVWKSTEGAVRLPVLHSTCVLHVCLS